MAGQPLFLETAESSGVRNTHYNSPTSQKYPLEIMGAGVALIDYDSDGWLDLFFVNGAALSDPMKPGQHPDKSRAATWNRLYRNLGNGKFEDITQKSGLQGKGYGMGAAVGDIDNDGDPDLYVTNYGPNLIYRNNNDGTFSDVTSRAGADDSDWSTSAAFFDYDNDSDLDLYVANYAAFSFDRNPYCGEQKSGFRTYCHPDQFPGSPDRLYRNNGNGTFTDVSEQAGIDHPEGKGLGVVTGDYNRDGWQDIYVANDKVANFLYQGTPEGVFKEVGFFSNVSYSRDGLPEAGMGVDMADYNGDGWPDLVVTNLSFEGTSLYQNMGDGSFFEVSLERGLDDSLLMVGFGTRFFDFDNDTDLDLLSVNGHVMDNIQLYQDQLTFRQPKQLFENMDGRFVNASPRGGDAINQPTVGRGAAFGDLNNDGHLDVVVANCGENAQILMNQTAASGNWLLLDLESTRSNPDGVGTLVQIHLSHLTLARIKTGGASYLSAHDHRLHVGLGNASQANLEVHWQSGCVQILNQVKANQILTVREPDWGKACVGKSQSPH